jgi:tetratricopeptide (TPR) repeat protein
MKRQSYCVYLFAIGVVIFVKYFLCVLPCNAQPTSMSDFRPAQRRQMTQNVMEKVTIVSNQIENDKKNVNLYKKLLDLYKSLFEINFDNKDWDIYVDKYEATLSFIIELEKNSNNLSGRGGILTERFIRSPSPKNISELYPHNRYFDQAKSDYLEALQLTSDARELQSIYGLLSRLLSERPQKLALSPNLPKFRDKIKFGLVFDDFEESIKYRRKALEIVISLSFADGLRSQIAGAYQINAITATKLGAYEKSLEMYDAGKTYLGSQNQPCSYYAEWGNVYLKLKKVDKAIETFNTTSITDSAYCSELLGNRGDAFSEKNEFQKALANYDAALKLNEKDTYDSLKMRGWILIKRAKLYLKLGRATEALQDLNLTVEKKYISECSLVYQVRADTYRKLGESNLAKIDKQKAEELEEKNMCQTFP